MKGRKIVFAIGENQIIKITGFDHDGAGIGRIDGMAVFVPGALPGEEVEVQVTAIKKKYARARMVSIVQESSARVEPICPHVPDCGGCQLQHLQYSEQLEFKSNAVVEAFTRLGKLRGIPVRPVLSMDNPWRYRNRAQFHVGLVEGKLRLGYFSQNSHRLVPVQDCHLLPQSFSGLVRSLEETLGEFGIIPFDVNSREGCLRHVVIKKGWSTGETMVILVTATDRLPVRKQLIKALQVKCPQVVSWVQNVNAGQRTVLGPTFKLLAGQSKIKEKLNSLEFLLSPPAFFQVNTRQAAVLYDKAVAYANLTGKETVFDLYCGTGTLSLFLAQQAAHVYGVEFVAAAVEDARENALHNKISNVEFLAGKTEKLLPQLAARQIKPDVVVLDPPRQGVSPEVLATITDLSPGTVVYVSCDPATLARDLNILHQRGYKAVEVQPVDMFSQTYHVECVTLMSRVKD